MGWTAGEIAEITGGSLLRDTDGAPTGFSIDSRDARPGDLFIGIPGETFDGGSFAPDVIEAGAWGVLARESSFDAAAVGGGALIVHPDPVAALGKLATRRLAEIGCKVIMITGSNGKTSTKDITAALVSRSKRTFASRDNRNTEIGMPLEVLRAPGDCEVMILEAAMRGPGQIALLAAMAPPDVGVITNIGPAHLELLGSIEAIARAKAELVAGLMPGKTAVVPANEALLTEHLRDDLTTVTFGEGGDVSLLAIDGRRLEILMHDRRHAVEVDFDQPHNRVNLLAAAAAADAIGVNLPGRLNVDFSAWRGDRIELSRGIVVIDDCYNANPMSMRAALEDLAGEAARRGGRSVAVLGDMLELGPQEELFHREIGEFAAGLGVGVLIAVGNRSEAIAAGFGEGAVTVPDATSAAGMAGELLEPGDTVLVKASRGIGLEAVTSAIRESED